jgi:polyphosphate kinase
LFTYSISLHEINFNLLESAFMKNNEFINRELSWLSFNERVLQEAQDEGNPLVERVRFLGIFSNNLDEFFRVRVASLKRLAGLGRQNYSTLDFSPTATLAAIRKKVVELQATYAATFENLEAKLAEERVFFRDHTQLTPEQILFVEDYYRNHVRANLVPIMLNPGHPFPELEDQSVYLAIELKVGRKSTDRMKYALIEVPPHMERFLVLPKEGDDNFVMFLDDVIRLKLRRLFSLFNPTEFNAYAIKITRDAELDIDDDLTRSLVDKMKQGIDLRKKGNYVRFLYDKRMPQDMIDFLMKKMKIKDRENMIPGSAYHNKKDLMSFPDFGRADLRFKPLPPQPHRLLRNKISLLDEIKKKDILLHYPYQMFNYVVDILREAAIDPHVTRVQINLYRVAKNSHVVNALINAARNGKNVEVIIEIQARFDEKNNIKVASMLQEAGARVIFGVPGLKVHSKLMLITREEKDVERMYAHIGTGNFHERTARIYSDVALLTADQRITSEVGRLFEFFENNYQRVTYRHLIVSPYSTRRKYTELINREIRNAEAGKKAFIILKLNNLVDPGMIRKLYDASNAGVKINLIIRGVCCLIPGVKGMSENISAISLVGRFLEHSRIFVFGNGGKPEYFLSSADWMSRNLDHRVEVSVPILDADLKKELDDYLSFQFKGNVKSRIIDKSQRNQYVTKDRAKKRFNSQEEVYNYFAAKANE